MVVKIYVHIYIVTSIEIYQNKHDFFLYFGQVKVRFTIRIQKMRLLSFSVNKMYTILSGRTSLPHILFIRTGQENSENI